MIPPEEQEWSILNSCHNFPLWPASGFRADGMSKVQRDVPRVHESAYQAGYPINYSMFDFTP
jgi:hypothetical protein